MLRSITRFLRDEEGATAIEYGIIAGLMAIVLAAIFSNTDGTLAAALRGVFSQFPRRWAAPPLAKTVVAAFPRRVFIARLVVVCCRLRFPKAPRPQLAGAWRGRTGLGRTGCWPAAFRTFVDCSPPRSSNRVRISSAVLCPRPHGGRRREVRRRSRPLGGLVGTRADLDRGELDGRTSRRALARVEALGCFPQGCCGT